MSYVTYPLQLFFSNGSNLLPWKVSIGGRNITNQRFADALAEEEQELKIK